MQKQKKWLPVALLVLLAAGLILAAGPIYAGGRPTAEDDLQVVKDLPPHSVGLMKSSDLAALLALD